MCKYWVAHSGMMKLGSKFDMEKGDGKEEDYGTHGEIGSPAALLPLQALSQEELQQEPGHADDGEQCPISSQGGKKSAYS